MQEVNEHIGRHVGIILQEHMCDTCQLPFGTKADLERHMKCAASGHCGLPLQHHFDCTGHHPPSEFPETVNDFDRLLLCKQLINWKVCQIRAYNEFIVDVERAMDVKETSGAWACGGSERDKDFEEHRRRGCYTASARVQHGRIDPWELPPWVSSLNNAVVRASSVGNIGRVAMMVDSGISVNAHNFENASALFAATKNNKLKMVRWLLNHGASMTSSPSKLLSVAGRMRNIEPVTLLLDTLAQGESEHSFSATLTTLTTDAIQTGDDRMATEFFKLATARGVDRDDDFFSNLLHAAASSGNVETAKLLIVADHKHGASFSSSFSDSFETAASFRNFDMIMLLLKLTSEPSSHFIARLASASSGSLRYAGAVLRSFLKYLSSWCCWSGPEKKTGGSLMQNCFQ
jgi:hypothetical protein